MRIVELLAAAFITACVVLGPPSVAVADGLRPAPVRDQASPDCAEFVTVKAKVSYPREELRRRVEGWVALNYKLTGDGTARDIHVVDSEPKDVFVQAAASQLQQSRFVEGKVQPSCLHIVQFQVR